MNKIFAVLTGLLLGTSACFGVDYDAETRKMMNALNAGDSAVFCSFFQRDAFLHHLGDEGLETITLADFSGVLRKFKAGEYREEFTEIKVNTLETGLTYVDVSFSFYINEQLAFSGIDHVIWIQNGISAHIHCLYTGSLKPKFTTANGTSTTNAELDQYMNQWHQDVAKAELNEYFDFMTDDFIFLGTDPAERWTKEQFLAFCQPYFESGKTWEFKPNWRNWYLHESGEIAWFEESLHTWMEECRGSGVLKKVNGTWKIAHYNLSVLIENEKIQKFIKLRKK